MKPGSMPFGSRAGWNDAIATCFSVTLRSVPATVNLRVGELDVGLGGFQHVRGELLALHDDLLGRQASAPCRR